jgi:hypothetical protein
MSTEYVTSDDLKDVLTEREKAERHLKKWSRAKLLSQTLNSASIGWIAKWAGDYDSAKGTQ